MDLAEQHAKERNLRRAFSRFISKAGELARTRQRQETAILRIQHLLQARAITAWRDNAAESAAGRRMV